jgi:threonine-phosphate decarboxylase
VNVLAEEAALAAIADEEHARRTREFVAAERAWFTGELARIPGLRPLPSCANYLAVDCAIDSGELYRALLERKILIRCIEPRRIRLAVRTRAENGRLVAALRESQCAV